MEECASCIHSEPAVLDGIDENKGEKVVVLKCYRYPAQLMVDEDGMITQANPEAVHICGEFTAEKTTPVVGTIRKVIDHATRISNRVIGHLHSVRGRNNHLQNDGSTDRPQDGVGP